MSVPGENFFQNFSYNFAEFLYNFSEFLRISSNFIIFSHFLYELKHFSKNLIFSQNFSYMLIIKYRKIFLKFFINIISDEML